jgi:hypothetical protein
MGWVELDDGLRMWARVGDDVVGFGLVGSTSLVWFGLVWFGLGGLGQSSTPIET